MKFCRDCIHTRRYRLSIDHSADGERWACVAKGNTLPDFDLVTGEPKLLYRTCHEARAGGGGCGYDGLWWQAKPQTQERPRAQAPKATDELSPEDFL